MLIKSDHLSKHIPFPWRSEDILNCCNQFYTTGFFFSIEHMIKIKFKSLRVSSILILKFKFKKEKQDIAKRKGAYEEIEKQNKSSRLIRPSGGK